MVLILTVLPAEIISGWHRDIYRREDLLVTGGCFLLSQLVRPVVALLYATLFSIFLPVWRGALADTPLWLALPGVLLFSEFCFYWVHRLAHSPGRNNLLWGMHRTHHAARYLNVTVMARVNIFWPFVVPYAWTTGLSFYLCMHEAAAITLGILLMWNAFTHSAFRWDDVLAKTGWGKKLLWLVELVFITPRLHHTHHGWGRDGKTYRNFATVISLFDRLFGTLYVPGGRPARYGLPGSDWHWLQQIFFPLCYRPHDRVYVAGKK